MDANTVIGSTMPDWRCLYGFITRASKPAKPVKRVRVSRAQPRSRSPYDLPKTLGVESWSAERAKLATHYALATRVIPGSLV